MQAILARLKPTDIWDYMIYIIAVLALVTLFMQKNAGLQMTLMCVAVIMCGLIDKVAVGPHSAGYSIDPTDLTAFLLRIPMFVFPLIIAGITKQEKSRPVAILTGVIALVYLFGRWATIPHTYTSPNPGAGSIYLYITHFFGWL